MKAVRIVCTHDGKDTAQTLERWLAAEGHEVNIQHGRASLVQLEAAKAEALAVILIWSKAAPVASYMLQWRQSIPQARLVEIALETTHPDYPRRWPVIDFSSSKGGRGSAAWRTLSERLRTIQRANQPPKPVPWRAAATMTAVSLATVGVAMGVRMQDHTQQMPAAPTVEHVALNAQSMDGQGGPLVATEPAGADDVTLGRLAPRYTPIPFTQEPTLLVTVDLAPSVHARNAGLFERVADLGDSLLRRIDGDSNSASQIQP